MTDRELNPIRLMRNRMMLPTRIRFLGVLICSTTFAVGDLWGEDAAPPKETGADPFAAELQQLRGMWSERATRHESARYTLRGTMLHTQGSLVYPDDTDAKPGTVPATGFPIEDTVTDFTIDWLVDFERGLFRKRSHNVAFNLEHRAFRPFVRDEVYDGQGLKGHWLRDANTSNLYVPAPDSPDVVYWDESDANLVVNWGNRSRAGIGLLLM